MSVCSHTTSPSPTHTQILVAVRIQKMQKAINRQAKKCRDNTFSVTGVRGSACSNSQDGIPPSGSLRLRCSAPCRSSLNASVCGNSGNRMAGNRQVGTQSHKKMQKCRFKNVHGCIAIVCGCSMVQVSASLTACENRQRGGRNIRRHLLHAENSVYAVFCQVVNTFTHVRCEHINGEKDDENL